jgi:phosphatidylglycerol---prolipoprotein diacylglyceryl transferase
LFPKLISVGWFTVSTYGVLVAAGLVTGLYVASRLSEREGLNRDEIYTLGVYVALAGIIGSKGALVIQERAEYWHNPGQFFSFTLLQSGGIFYGGLILAIIVGVWYTRRRQIPFLKSADAFAPGIAIGHALGRLGCFSAGCCWGLPTSLPWGVTFTNPYSNQTVGVPLNQPLHPTQLYEAAAEFVIFLILYSQYRKKQFDGQMLGWYLVLYSTVRFLVEFLRAHEPGGDAMLWQSGLSAAQGVSLLLIAAGAYLLWLRPHNNTQPATARS